MPKPDKRDFEERYSACFLDFGVKTVTGLLIGSLMGSFFLHGFRKWPMYIGGGLGAGMAYMNCENSLNNFLLSMDPKACIIKFAMPAARLLPILCVGEAFRLDVFREIVVHDGADI